MGMIDMENKYKDKIIKTETFKCMLCHNAACTKACPNGFDPARFIRSIRFENKDGAYDMADAQICATCNAPCENSCIHYDGKIRIKDIITSLDAKKIDTYDSSNSAVSKILGDKEDSFGIPIEEHQGNALIGKCDFRRNLL